MTKTNIETEGPKEQKQITIDLEKIYNPNPELVKTYEDAKATYIWVDKDKTPEYVNESRVFGGSESLKEVYKT